MALAYMSHMKQTNIKTFLAEHKMHRCFKYALIAITYMSRKTFIVPLYLLSKSLLNNIPNKTKKIY